MVFAQLPRGFSALLLLNRRKGYNASLSLKPRRLFISFARTKETKQRKFAGCTFWATPASVSAKQKELANAQTASALAAGAFHFFARTKKRNKEIRRLPLQS